jgi:hypothetical protein
VGSSVKIEYDYSYYSSPIVIISSTNNDGSYDWTIPSGMTGRTNYLVRVSSISSPSVYDDSDAFTIGAGPQSFSRSYTWDYGGQVWTYNISIPASFYNDYKGRVHQTFDFTQYVTSSDSVVMQMASTFKTKADSMGYNSYETVSFVMAFVQSLPYTSDLVTTGHDEYPRYPVETLVDNGGDCEDTAILMASMLQASPLNYDCILLELPADNPNHMATGVWGSGQISGTYFPFNGRNYYYCETTGDGWEIGELPQQYEGVSARMLQI